MIKFVFRFLGTNSRFIPAHSAEECVDSMVTIAKVCAMVKMAKLCLRIVKRELIIYGATN